MPGIAGADILVGWAICRASRVAASDRLNAGEHLEDRFGAPKTAAAESGEFSFVGQAVNVLRLSETCGDAAEQRAENPQTANFAVHSPPIWGQGPSRHRRSPRHVCVPDHFLERPPGCPQRCLACSPAGISPG